METTCQIPACSQESMIGALMTLNEIFQLSDRKPGDSGRRGLHSLQGRPSKLALVRTSQPADSTY